MSERHIPYARELSKRRSEGYALKYSEFLSSEERFCVLRWQATAVAIAGVLLGSAGLLALARGLHNLCFAQLDDESCASSISEVTNS